MPGGVCAVLDYEVELMAEYVGEMATRLALGSPVAPAPFRKFISQILSSTRLPSTTILLGMNYLSKRINLMRHNNQALKITEGQVWRLLTVALLLGSKFLDDNTFQNRSWSEVSGIPVRELNSMESDWMRAIDWQLYVDLDESQDYTAWLKSWEDWSGHKKRQQAMVSRERLHAAVPAIDTDVARARQAHAATSWYEEQVAEYRVYEQLSVLKRNEHALHQGYRGRETSWPTYQPGPWTNPPLTPPDSGYGTPEYLNSTTMNFPCNDWFAQQTRQSSQALPGGGYARQQPFRQHGSSQSAYHSRNASSFPVYNMYGHNIWEHNTMDCNCATCAMHNKQPYFAAPSHAYGQPVMG
ncbi:uncharacterized protein E0L32_002829 [Thyridium curvatum]|uniref:Cyclin-like protein n=1 Tax=Thyridium curvatum TaxID=1093900 RepID=A0A507BLY7_9PEZI|nr:uncharacterized protein E0L32_002829 [Thyridium curvatum]TPX17728.1 hypothetical protein E0L32_002829 [Thyridium curvatum]